MNQARADRYRRQIEECRKLAEKASNTPDREAWLKVAAEWRKLTEDAGNSANDNSAS
jgi:hypothetical protein